MNPLALLSITAALAATSLLAQESVTVRVATDPPTGVRYSVDGQMYTQASAFVWPVGSKHVIAIVNAVVSQNGIGDFCGDTTNIASQYTPDCRSRFTFAGWETNNGALQTAAATVLAVTADPKTTLYRAKFAAEYRVDVAFADQPAAATGIVCNPNQPLGVRPAHGGSGIVVIGGRCLPYSAKLWLTSGSYPLQGIPYDGFVFTGFGSDAGIDNNYVSALTVTGPTVLHARFQPAKRVRLYTDPLELKLNVDRTIVPTINPDRFILTYPIPGYFDWVGGSRHTLGAVSPQLDIDGRAWIFDSWSNGGTQDMAYTADNITNTISTLTAKFVRGANVSFLVEPAGLRIKVEERENWPSYNFVWGQGKTYSVAAPAEQVDARGRKYIFKGWSNGGPAAQEITIDQTAVNGGLRMIATFEAVPQVIIRSSLPAAPIKVDGADCLSPCKLDRPAGTSVNVSVPSSIPVSEVSRYEFQGWGDSTESSRTVTFDQDAQTLTASYRMANRLIAVVDPEIGADIRMQPASPEGFYLAGSQVTVVAETKPGYKFRRWEGDLTGTQTSGTVFVSAPRVIKAMLDRVPFVEPSGVRNSAGETPEKGVAAGSLISILGANLSRSYEASGSGVLAQTLAGAVVFLADRLLPLTSVSPEQINAQLPYDLEPGSYTLVVRPEGEPDVKAEFTLVRNAPGLFSTSAGDVFTALALHEDGTPITPASPARRGEMITLTGTGFGPHNRRLLEGFPVSANPSVTVVDPTEVVAGDLRFRPDWTGAQPGLVGVTGVRFRVNNELPSGNRDIRVTVNGIESNTVVLPVE